MKNTFLFLFLCISLSFQLSAQQNVTKEMLKAEFHNLDQSANSATLYEKVLIEYMHNAARGYYLSLNYTFLIKIYNQQAFDRGDFEIPFYKSGNSKERVSHIKGYTYNLEGSKIVESKLDKKNIYVEEISDKYFEKKFAMPNVKAGSIIEVSYTVTSPFIYTIPKWYFQNYTPTDKSEFILEIPSMFALTAVPTGFLPLERKKEEVNLFEGRGTRVTIIGKDIPAIKEDNYVLNENDYRSGIKYETYSVNFVGQPTQYYSKDWNQIATNLMNADYFGRQIKKKFKALTPIITQAKALGMEERKRFLYDYVRTNYAWNKKYGLGSYEGLKKVISEKTGNIGDLNLLLLNLLKRSDVEAFPIILKSRFRGILNVNYPSLSELNYVIVMVQEGEKVSLLDASSHLSPFGELPIRAANIYALKINDDSAQIVELNNPNKFQITTASEYAINLKDKSLEGSSQRRRRSYAATKYRQDISKDKEEQEDEGSEKEEGQEEDISSFSLENTYSITEALNIEDIEQPIKLTYDESLFNCTKMIDAQIFINSTLDFGMKKNPFDDETREFPIFYNYKISNRNIANITIPKGYVLESKPESISIVLPNKIAKFTYDVRQIGDRVNISYMLNINKEIIQPDEYPSLKQFYEIIFKLTNEKIVLRKTDDTGRKIEKH